MRILVLLTTSLIASSAMAFSVNRTRSHHIIRWYDRDNTIPLEIDADGPIRLRSGDTQADVRAAIDRAVASWNDVSCNAMSLAIAGTTTETTNVVTDGVDAQDFINRVVWIEQAERYSYGSLVLGVTSPLFYQDGTIVEADVVLNGVDNTWAVYKNLSDVPGGSTDPTEATDVESVVVHELGHLLGLGHVLDGAEMAEPPTMTPTVDPRLRTRTLEATDRDGVCFLYPVGSRSCDADGDCPQFIEQVQTGDGLKEDIADFSRCVNNTCTKIEEVPCGDGDVGDRCCTNNCKGSGSCLALAQDQTSYCVSACSSSRPCPDGFTCAPLEGGGGACISDVVLGCSCDVNDSCTTSCACDSDCGRMPDPTNDSDDGGGCAATQHPELWAVVAFLAVFVRRRELVGSVTI